MAKKSNANQLKEGQFLSETQYYKIKNIIGDIVEVENERGFTFSISKPIIEEGIFSADQFTEEVKVSRTELINIFTSVGDTVFTVCYHKQPKAEDVNEAIASANKGRIIPIAELQKVVKEAYKGEERVLTGYMVNVETGFGRSTVIDLEADKSKTTDNWDSRLRQVDHRTLNWLIYQNKKYIVKK